MGCAAQGPLLPAPGSGDLAVGISGDYRAETATKTVSTFPSDDARTALAAATDGLKACRKGGDAVVVDATVEFAPSGRVRTLKVDPAHGPVAECVRADLVQIQIPRFDGPPVAMDLKTTL